MPADDQLALSATLDRQPDISTRLVQIHIRRATGLGSSVKIAHKPIAHVYPRCVRGCVHCTASSLRFNRRPSRASVVAGGGRDGQDIRGLTLPRRVVVSGIAKPAPELAGEQLRRTQQYCVVGEPIRTVRGPDVVSLKLCIKERSWSLQLAIVPVWQRPGSGDVAVLACKLRPVGCHPENLDLPAVILRKSIARRVYTEHEIRIRRIGRVGGRSAIAHLVPTRIEELDDAEGASRVVSDGYGGEGLRFAPHHILRRGWVSQYLAAVGIAAQWLTWFAPVGLAQWQLRHVKSDALVSPIHQVGVGAGVYVDLGIE
eukprot:COSAG02_NODE_328_length_24547_cov_4.124141_29_plen_314_part_00